MKILIISDGHGNIANLKALKNIAANADLIIYAGDFAAFKKIETGQPFLAELVQLNTNIFSVLGNCDPPSFLEKIENAGISVQGKIAEYSGFLFAGSGGGSKFTGITPFERTDEELVSDLKSADGINEGKSGFSNLIIITHNPPYGTQTDKIATGIHVGSKLIRNFIEKNTPLLVVSGHIHEAFSIDKLGSTVLINPGSLTEGRYAIADITGNREAGYIINAELKTHV